MLIEAPVFGRYQEMLWTKGVSLFKNISIALTFEKRLKNKLLNSYKNYSSCY